MKPEIKERWVTALRSGKYQQGRGTLKNEHEHFCCLGVLCDLHANETHHTWSQSIVPGNFVYGRAVHFLPVEVQVWSGLASSVGRYGDNDDDTLMFENDSGRSFSEIANIIEEKL